MAIREAYKKIEIKDSKGMDLVKELQKQKEFVGTFKYLKWEDKIKLSFYLIDLLDSSRLFLNDDLKFLEGKMLEMGKFTSDHRQKNILWKALIKLREESYQKENITIDFTDMIYMPVKFDLTFTVKPFYIFIDEIQDLSELQHKIVDKLLKDSEAKRWVGVGDRNQSIYLFSGAYSASFDLFLEKGKVKEMPLDICYRCPSSIIDSANEVFDVMEYGQEVKGIVKDIGDNYLLIKDKSMVICRNTFPLIQLYFKLIGCGKVCFIKGDDVLGSIIKFLKPHAYKTIAETKKTFKLEKLELQKDISEQGRFKLIMFNDNIENFKLLIENFYCAGDTTINTVVNKVKALFMQKEDGITLCTIHKSKGLENDIVYILNENLIPSKFASTPEQLKQEQNLKYVARTRAKKEMYFITLKD